MAPLLATLGDRAGSLSLAGETLSRAQQFAAANGGTDRFLVPRAWDWYGTVYENLARGHQGAGEQDIPDLRQAVEYYRKALEQWGKIGSDATGRFAAEIRVTRAKLAHCVKAAR
jgi:tetratricopeptide (TPR) repeat protein